MKINNLTENDLQIKDELIVLNDEYINAYIELWSDPSDRFSLEFKDGDTVDLYANYYPENDSLEAIYVHKNSDGGVIAEKKIDNLTDSEKDLILRLMKNEGLDECIEQMREEHEIQEPQTGMVMQ